MHTTSRSMSNGLAPIALVAVGVLIILGIAAAVAYDKQSVAFGLAGLTLAPILIFVALRWPTIFPFGLYAVTVPFDPLLKAASGQGATLTKFIGIITIIALLVRAYRMRQLYAPPQSWYVWLAFMIWAGAGLMWSIVPDDTIERLQIVGSLFALYSVTAIYPISLRSYIYARRSVVIAGVLTASYGFYAYASGQRLGSARLSIQSGNLAIDSNHYAAFFAIPIAFLTARFFCLQSTSDRLRCALLVIPMFINVLLTGSRGGVIAAVAVIIYAGVRAQKYRLLIISLVASVLLSFAVPNVWQRVFDPALQDASGRAEIWNTGLVAAAHTGFFGSGFGTFSDVYDDMLRNSVQRQFAGVHRPAHNILIQTLVDLGVPGVLLLLGAWTSSIVQNRKIARMSLLFPDAIATEASLIGIFVSALTIDLLWFKYLWLALIMVMLLANVTRPRLLAGRPTGQPENRDLSRMNGGRGNMPIGRNSRRATGIASSA